MTGTEIAQQNVAIEFASLLCVVFIVMSEWYQTRITEEKNFKIYIYVMLTGLIHNALFYIVLNLDRYTALDIQPLFGSYTAWSAVRLFHLFAVWALVSGMRCWIAWRKRHVKQN